MLKKKTYEKKIKVRNNGQASVIIPAEIRDEMGLKNLDTVCVTTIGNDRILVKLKKKEEKHELTS